MKPSTSRSVCSSLPRLAAGLVLAAAGLAPLAASAVTIDWVAIGNPGNAADTPSSNCFAASCGSVASSYYISKYEVTNAQYAEFLNAKAASDPLSLYSSFMGSDATSGGITQSGVSGSFIYAVKSGFVEQAGQLRLVLRHAALFQLAEQRARQREHRDWGLHAARRDRDSEQWVDGHPQRRGLDLPHQRE